ncbi:TetR/AcrR family transcriptional regulator [Sphingobium tyrosinilyticum]|uniref:TetR/AcrR family transcriptional regulator n=1 Tax=Sphingobium tyrosinilyticum TaxID=2715436 RepID=A0ABV9F1B1_9SPHN
MVVSRASGKTGQGARRKVASRTQQERSDATRGALILAGRRHFGERGFHDASTTDFTADAAVTRGALYHHFSDKKALFDAVVQDVATRLADHARDEVLAQVPEISTPMLGWRRLLIALRSYLRAVSMDPETQRILLIDAPAVLGWARWREIQAAVFLPGTAALLEQIMAAKLIRRADAGTLAQFILAATNDAALLIANAPDSEKGLEQCVETLMVMMDGLLLSGG